MVQSALLSEAFLLLGSRLTAEQSLGAGPKLLLATGTGLLSPATCCPSAFLDGFGFLSWTSQVLCFHKILLALVAPAAPVLCGVRLTAPFDSWGCARQSRQLRGAGTQVQPTLWKLRESVFPLRACISVHPLPRKPLIRFVVPSQPTWM